MISLNSSDGTPTPIMAETPRRNTVKQHGGKIDVETEPGEFTEFILNPPAGQRRCMIACRARDGDKMRRREFIIVVYSWIGQLRTVSAIAMLLTTVRHRQFKTRSHQRGRLASQLRISGALCVVDWTAVRGASTEILRFAPAVITPLSPPAGPACREAPWRASFRYC